MKAFRRLIYVKTSFQDLPIFEEEEEEEDQLQEDQLKGIFPSRTRKVNNHAINIHEKSKMIRDRS